MDVREKLVELIRHAKYNVDRICLERDWCDGCPTAYGEGDCKEAYIADRLIANGVTVQEWISVKEPPKNRGCYLVTVNHWLDGKPVVREARWNGVDWLSCYKAEELTPRVTHWMPLPKPPKGGAEG